MQIFKTRLKTLGIDSKTKLLPNQEMNNANDSLARRRDTNKKVNKNKTGVKTEVNLCHNILLFASTTK